MPTALSGWMAFTLYVSAARADATPAQLARLRAEVVPALEALRQKDNTSVETRRALAVVLTRVQAIMGADWQPQGEWLRAINSMLGEGHGRQAQQGHQERPAPEGEPPTR